MFEFDHLMVCVSSPDSDVGALVNFGLTVGHRGFHAGQGTANAVFFFDNAYLELVWIREPSELERPEVAPTGLAHRLRWRETGASPFGVSFRRRSGTNQRIPIETWEYHAPFLPEGALPIPIGTNSSNLAEPLVFASLVPRRPETQSLRPALQCSRGFREITALHVTFAGDDEPSSALRVLEGLGVATFCRGRLPHAIVELDGTRSGQCHDFTPALPLSLRW